MGGELRGLRALVIGASKGIGYAVATRLRDEGATVLGTARTAPPDLTADVASAGERLPATTPQADSPDVQSLDERSTVSRNPSAPRNPLLQHPSA
jgi:NAD(P)-dependent dehydrogenase (short-subunit alcohol dehydrogenase family)